MPGFSGSAVTPCTMASSEVPPTIITWDMMAAPALEPAIRPPSRLASRMAASTGVSTPPGARAAMMRAWLPPVK